MNEAMPLEYNVAGGKPAIVVPVEHLRECFDYDRDTGALTWKERPAGHFRSEAHRRLFNATQVGKQAGWVHSAGYWEVRVRGKTFKAHRVIWALVYGSFPAKEIDHINGIKTDNRIENLRPADVCQNQWNRTAYPTSRPGLKGVSKKSQRGRYRANIRANGANYHLGTFDTADEAAHAYNKAAILLHGEFARLNPIGADHAR